MHNITLVGTNHGENSNCNQNEFYKIIEAINPEVIFEELSPLYFNDYYIDKVGKRLETSTIIKYLENHQIEHILVDCAEIPPQSFRDLHRSMHIKIEKKATAIVKA